MKGTEQCRAITLNGERCSRRAQAVNFCTQHAPKPRRFNVVTTAETITKVTVAAAGAIGLVEKIIELWRSLPFGAAPEMPSDYQYLSQKIRPALPTGGRSRMAVFNKSASSVNWELARTLYDQGNMLYESSNISTTDIDELEEIAAKLIDELQPQIRAMLLEALGSSE